jgi:hypothetical protein
MTKLPKILGSPRNLDNNPGGQTSLSPFQSDKPIP